MAGMVALALGGPAYGAVGGAQSGTTTTTTSTKTVYHDTAIQVSIATYETRVLGLSAISVSKHGKQYKKLAHGLSVVYDNTLSLPPTAGEVSVALQAAEAAILSDLAVAPRGEIHISPPVLVVDSTTSSSQTATTVTGSNTTITSTLYVGPQTILIGDEQSQSFVILAGQRNVDTLTKTDVNRDVTTTTTTNQHATYTVEGSVCISPIVLKMNGETRLEASGGHWQAHPGQFDIAHKALFDFYGNGFPVAMEWVGPSDGLLCKPKTDGSVDGTCLFGTSTGFSSGYEQLASLDENMDGRVSGKELKGLFVWQDRNGNARADIGELKSLQEVGVTELNVAHKDYKSTFTMNGKSCTMYDWWPTTLEIKKQKPSV